jgi:hypothetical protein
MDKEYVVTSKIRSLSFLNGYVCQSESKDHFLRHLGHRFSKCCDMNQLNNAYKTGEIIIDIHKPFNKEFPSVWPKDDKRVKPNIVDEYWGRYGYILEINHGTAAKPVIEKRTFVNDTEAQQWVDSQ